MTDAKYPCLRWQEKNVRLTEVGLNSRHAGTTAKERGTQSASRKLHCASKQTNQAYAMRCPCTRCNAAVAQTKQAHALFGEKLRASSRPGWFRGAPGTGRAVAGVANPAMPFSGPLETFLPEIFATHLLSGWPRKSPNFIFTTKMVFPKSLKFMNVSARDLRKRFR